MTPVSVAELTVLFLERNRVRHASEPLPPLAATGSARKS